MKKAVIAAAGFGTRFLPATKAVPKEMFTVVDKPVIHYVAEDAVKGGAERILIIISEGKECIKDYFTSNKRLEKFLLQSNKRELLEEARAVSKMADFEFVYQKKQRGLADAVMCAEQFVDGDEFALLLGDDLINTGDGPSCVAQLGACKEKTGLGAIACMKVDEGKIKKYGNVKPGKIVDNRIQVLDLIEKPDEQSAFSNLAVIGRYLLDANIFEEIRQQKKETEEVCFTKTLSSVAKKWGMVACEFEGRRFDAGDKAGFVRANVEYMLGRAEFKEDFKRYLKNLF